MLSSQSEGLKTEHFKKHFWFLLKTQYGFLRPSEVGGCSKCCAPGCQMLSLHHHRCLVKFSVLLSVPEQQRTVSPALHQPHQLLFPLSRPVFHHQGVFPQHVARVTEPSYIMQRNPICACVPHTARVVINLNSGNQTMAL